MERFFVYSKEHNKPIRLLVQPAPEDKMKYINVIVLAWDNENILYLRARKSDIGKPPLTLPRNTVFSADYARGDHGDTMQFMEGYSHD
jgi:hypothetical protein